jgi:hypothetical protein
LAKALVTLTPTPCKPPEKTVGTAFTLVEFAARMQAGEHQLDDRRFFLRVHAKGNATPIVVNRDGPIGVQYDLNFLAMAGQGFVGGVVQHFLNNVRRVVCPGVHTRPLFDWLQSFQDANGAFGISVGGGLRGR